MTNLSSGEVAVFNGEENVLIWEMDKRILDIIVADGPQTRRDLMRKTKIARTTLYDALLRLQTKKLLMTGKKQVSSTKPDTMWFARGT